MPILIYAVSGETDAAKLKSELNNQVSPILQSANGVASAVATGGLATSTLLTLFVVPVVYTLFDDLGRLFRKEKRDLVAPTLIPPNAEAFEREPMERHTGSRR